MIRSLIHEILTKLLIDFPFVQLAGGGWAGRWAFAGGGKGVQVVTYDSCATTLAWVKVGCMHDDAHECETKCTNCMARL